MDIWDLTRGYFEKTEIQKKRVHNKILAQCIYQLEIEGVPIVRLNNRIEELIEKAVEREHYEVAEVLRIIKGELDKPKTTKGNVV